MRFAEQAGWKPSRLKSHTAVSAAVFGPRRRSQTACPSRGGVRHGSCQPVAVPGAGHGGNGPSRGRQVQRSKSWSCQAPGPHVREPDVSSQMPKRLGVSKMLRRAQMPHWCGGRVVKMSCQTGTGQETRGAEPVRPLPLVGRTTGRLREKDPQVGPKGLRVEDPGLRARAGRRHRRSHSHSRSRYRS